MYLVWTKEKCLELAKNYKLLVDFRNANYRAYQAAWRNGWIEDLKLIPKFCWTKELCQIEAKKYTKRTQLQLHNTSAYQAALRNQWLDEFYPKKGS